jgi:hypothetical protein
MKVNYYYYYCGCCFLLLLLTEIELSLGGSTDKTIQKYIYLKERAQKHSANNT